MGKNKGGRPTKLTPEIHEKIVSLMRAGNYLETAALACGLKPHTVRSWLREAANQKSGAKRKFLIAVREAMAEPETRDMSVIDIAASSDWRAAAWRLEHRYPQRFSKKTVKNQVSGPKGGPVVVESKTADEMSDDELAAIAAKAAG